MPLRILIVDDHEPVRRGIRSLLASCQDWSVCGEAADGLEATRLARQLRPDVILMDISMPQIDGMEATRIIRDEVPESEVIIVSQNDPAVVARQAAEVKARAFVSKSALLRDLIPSIQEISRHRNSEAQNRVRVTSKIDDLTWLQGGGAMGALIRSTEWSQTPLGDPHSWSPALRMMTKFLLANRFPQLLWWGPQFCSIYNDAYVPILGEKHPWAIGRPVEKVWGEIWHVLKPLIEIPYQGGPATWMEDIPLEINRTGSFEETHFTVAYSPVPDETVPGGIGGVLATVHEITDKVIGERRTSLLRDLGVRSVEPKSAEDACNIAAETFSRYPKDIPFAFLYLLDANREAHFVCAAGADDDSCRKLTADISSQMQGETWPIRKLLETEEIQFVPNLSARFEHVPQGPWSDPPQAAAIVPVRSNISHQLAGFLIVGLSSRLQFDEKYRDFVNLVSSQIATSVGNARAYEEERKRAEALAEIDRAKTLFFSNVSHEFRTPLTLILGTLEDALAVRGGNDSGQRERLEVAHRNSLRLMKLVNTLLDFSRIEAGRIQACYEPTDLATFTAELASVFRSAVERAGLKLLITCVPISESVYIDREMWEKIVFNLLSNAFKFTFSGEIEVSLRESNDAVELGVRDTGTGIPPQDLPRLFERFYRVENAQGRTFEGSGIGLALVQELVKLHGGSVRAESQLRKGSRFSVTVPLGKAHLPPDRVAAERTQASTGLAGEAYVQEALRWLPRAQNFTDEITTPPLSSELGVPAPNLSPEKRPRVLVADDNADMRDYLQRLLRHHYRVEAVADGDAALSSAHAIRPDLIVSDIMMPRLDGFGLLQAIRADEALRNIPLILLSARAGEESRIEGLQAGADDYLVKPFSARELLASVGSHLEIARIREQSEQQYKDLAQTLDREVRARTQELELRNADVVTQSERLRELSWRLLHMQDEERRRIARELHDSAGQTLAVLGMTLSSLVESAKQMPPEAAQSAKEAEELARQLTKEIRTTSYLLHPPLLDENGLPAALSWYISGLADRSQLDIAFQISENFGRLVPEMELAVFRVVQECLTNIHRHSGSKTASIEISREADRILIEVRDQGRGMAPEKLAEIQSKGSGVGVRGIRERLRQFQGEMVIESTSAGTTVLVTIPVTKGEPAVNRATSPSIKSETNFDR